MIALRTWGPSLIACTGKKGWGLRGSIHVVAHSYWTHPGSRKSRNE